MDDEPSHGQVPGTAAYDMRTQDAIPDQVAVIPERGHSSVNSRTHLEDRSLNPGGVPIPTTVLEQVEYSSPTGIDIPEPRTHHLHKADATPDVVLQAPGSMHSSQQPSPSKPGSTPGDLPIPTTVVSKVDTEPSHGEIPGTDAYNMRKRDAQPDVVEEKGDAPGMWLPTSQSTPSERLTESELPTSSIHRSKHHIHPPRERSGGGSPAIADDGGFGPMHYTEATDDQSSEEDEPADDFDDFEQGEGNEDFGDFDEAQSAQVDKGDHHNNGDPSVVQSFPSITPSFVSSTIITEQPLNPSSVKH